MMNRADADGHAQQIAQEFHDTAIRAAADQRQRDDHLAQPSLADGQVEQHVVSRRVRYENLIQCRTGLARLLADELATHAVLDRQITDRRRSCQRLNAQVLTVSRRQRRRRAIASSHIRTTPENVSVPSYAQPASIWPRV